MGLFATLVGRNLLWSSKASPHSPLLKVRLVLRPIHASLWSVRSVYRSP